MRRTYISPEFINKKAYGTFNTIEESSFFSSKMIEVEDQINISNNSIIWNQQINGDQIDISIESTGLDYIYSDSSSKKENHTIKIDENQSNYQKENLTRWILDIDINTILSSYVFASIKNSRAFEGVTGLMTIQGDVDLLIKDYIKNNILDRYKYKSIELLISYIDINSKNSLKYNPTWVSNLGIENKISKIQTELNINNSKLLVSFNQEKPSSQYSMEYFYNIIFEKI